MKIKEIVPQKTAVLVIDMQNDFIMPGAPIFVNMGLCMVPALKTFLQECRQNGIQIIYTKDVLRSDGKDMGKTGEFCEGIKKQVALVDGTQGAEIYKDIAPQDGDIVLKKNRYSAFYETQLDSILRTMRIDTLAITGVCTDCCCFSTARDAGQMCYDVAFISNLTGNTGYDDIGFGKINDIDLHNYMLTMIGHTTAHVMNSQEFLGKIIQDNSNV